MVLFPRLWHDTYFDAITILRTHNGGIRCPLVIEAAADGMDLTSLENLWEKTREP